MITNIPEADSARPPDWMADDFEIPPFQKLPERGTRLATENMICDIDGKIAQLANLGLRPHPNIIDYRLELVAQLAAGGPYKLRSTSRML
jgi:hypothetical protein